MEDFVVGFGSAIVFAIIWGIFRLITSLFKSDNQKETEKKEDNTQ